MNPLRGIYPGNRSGDFESIAEGGSSKSRWLKRTAGDQLHTENALSQLDYANLTAREPVVAVGTGEHDDLLLASNAFKDFP